MDDSPKTWIEAGAAALLGILTWGTRRQVSKWDAQAEDHSVRIRTLEATAATKGDISAVFDRVAEIGDTMNQQHAQILTLLVNRDHR